MGCFVAILNTNDAPVEERAIRSMMDVPPYGEAADRTICTDGPIGLGFSALHPARRGGHPPQPASAERVRAVFDGRLDDRATLVRRLEERLNRSCAPASDVELVLAAYEQWGTALAEQLLGDFALCIWDAARRTLVCARDHFGVRPLYYAYAGGCVVASNVLRSIRRHPAVSSRLNDTAMGDFLLFGLCLEPTQTSFADISRVPPGHTLTWSLGGGPRLERYWMCQPGPEVRYRDPQEYVDRFSSVLTTAVGDRLGDRNTGVFMSGGLDSSSVAATAAGLLGSSNAVRALRAFTVVYDTVAEDQERHYSTLVARHLGISIEHVAVDGYRLFDRWDRDALPPEPSSEPMTATMRDLLRRVSDHGSVVLSGDGGDPLLLPSSVLSQVGHVPLRTLAADLWRLAWVDRRVPPLGVRRAVRRLWRPQNTDMPGWFAEPLIRNVDLHARWASAQTMRTAANRTRGAALTEIVDPWWTSTFESYHPGATGVAVDLVYPFFDVRLVSFALTLPSSPWCVSKRILREAMRGKLPEQVRVRPKAPVAAGAPATHGPWSLPYAASLIGAAPAMAAYVDLQKFRSMARVSESLADSEPSALAAVALAIWLRAEGAVEAAA